MDNLNNPDFKSKIARYKFRFAVQFLNFMRNQASLLSDKIERTTFNMELLTSGSNAVMHSTVPLYDSDCDGSSNLSNLSSEETEASDNKQSVNYERFHHTICNQMQESIDEGLFEVSDELACFKRRRSQDDCLNSFSQAKLFSPRLKSSRARYNFQTGLINVLEGDRNAKAAAWQCSAMQISAEVRRSFFTTTVQEESQVTPQGRHR